MKRVCLIAFWILSATLICSAQTTFYYPHVADGVLGGNIWKTTIFLTNPAAATASGTITFRRDTATLSAAGSIFSTISFIDQDGAPAGNGGTITFSIPAGQTRKYTSAGGATYGGGFATVTTTVGTVSGTAIFSNYDLAGRLIAEAGVPAASAVANQAVFVDTVGGYNIGVAYANPGAAAANVTLSLLNSSAVEVATTPQILGPGNHAAAFTFQMFPNATQLAGTMRLQSSTPLAAIALRFDPSFSVFTTLPPISIASIVQPALKWMEEKPWYRPVASVAKLLGALRLRIA
jgi:hypothetical protein